MVNIYLYHSLSFWLLSESGLFSESRTERRADYLPVICKKMGIACEDDLMSLWTRPSECLSVSLFGGSVIINLTDQEENSVAFHQQKPAYQ